MYLNHCQNRSDVYIFFISRERSIALRSHLNDGTILFSSFATAPLQHVKNFREAEVSILRTAGYKSNTSLGQLKRQPIVAYNIVINFPDHSHQTAINHSRPFGHKVNRPM